MIKSLIIVQTIIFLLIIFSYVQFGQSQFIGIGPTTSTYFADLSYSYSGISFFGYINKFGLFDYEYQLSSISNWNDIILCYNIYSISESINLWTGIGISSRINPVFNIYTNANLLFLFNWSNGQISLEIEIPTWEFTNISFINYTFYF